MCLVTLESLATLSAAAWTALIQPVESVCPFISRSIWFWNSLYRSSYQSVNFPDRYLRNFNSVVYIASNGGSNPWDTATGWAADTSWLVATPWAPGGAAS